jgi:hypothetical protein
MEGDPASEALYIFNHLPAIDEVKNKEIVPESNTHWSKTFRIVLPA